MSTTILSCHHCNTAFSIATKEYNRQTKKGRDYFFCSRSCSTKHLNANMPEETKKRISDSLRKNTNRRGKAGKFTYYLNKARNRGKEHNLSEDYLETLWNGKCAITGIEIHLKDKDTKRSLSMASLDRINSGIGYVEGNVQFVAYGVNLAKNDFDDGEVAKFFKSITIT